MPWLSFELLYRRFASAFYLLLPANVVPGSLESTFAKAPTEAIVKVYAMMLGDFDPELFETSAFPRLALFVFALFMLISTVIMFNAVIAIMVRDQA